MSCVSGPFRAEFELSALTTEARVVANVSGLVPGEIERLSRVMAELGGNAIRHGGGAGRLLVLVDLEFWAVKVEDDGPGLADAVLRHPPTDSGLGSVRQLCTRLEFTNLPLGGARVVATRVFSSPNAAPKEHHP